MRQIWWIVLACLAAPGAAESGDRCDRACLEGYDLKADIGEARDVAASHPDVVARLEGLMSREHVASADFPLTAIDTLAPVHVAARTAAEPKALLDAEDGAGELPSGPSR